MRPALLLLAMLLVLPNASAIYIEMPLRLSAEPQQAKVGNEIEFTVEPSNDSARDALAGRTLRAIWSYDSGQEDAAPATGEIGDVILDGAARGSFRWTVPADADDKNVFITLVADGETYASSHVGVGEAPPMMMATGGAPSDGAIVDEGEDVEEAKETPAFTLVAVLAAAALGALLLAGRRR